MLAMSNPVRPMDMAPALRLLTRDTAAISTQYSTYMGNVQPLPNPLLCCSNPTVAHGVSSSASMTFES